MNILAIETSCDETAVAILKAQGDETRATFTVLGNGIVSQAALHREYGGVFPALAKRAHAQKLIPVLEHALQEAGIEEKETSAWTIEMQTHISTLLSREPDLAAMFVPYITSIRHPAIDAICVTNGPGLEPALWVGVNFAQALSHVWNIPIVPVNHMEGHILSSLAQGETVSQLSISSPSFPVLGLLISGGHTQLVLMYEWGRYELLGETRDDAVGEAFDKVARMLNLPYPGGPEISKRAEARRQTGLPNSVTLPRPMIDSGDCDFSFSGLKTAVLYMLKKYQTVTEADVAEISEAFEDAVAEVLWKKTARALSISDARMLVIGGGVSANTHINRYFTTRVAEEFPDVAFLTPPRALTTDNAIMIGIAGYYHARKEQFETSIVADGNLSLEASV